MELQASLEVGEEAFLGQIAGHGIEAEGGKPLVEVLDEDGMGGLGKCQTPVDLGCCEAKVVGRLLQQAERLMGLGSQSGELLLGGWEEEGRLRREAGIGAEGFRERGGLRG